MNALRRSDGYTLPEVLLASSLAVLLLGASLGVLDIFVRSAHRNGNLTESADAARRATASVAWDLRAATGYQTSTDTSGTAILRAGANDLVFKTVDPQGTTSASNPYAVRSVRWCRASGGTTLYKQLKTGSALPSTSCPDPAWSIGTAVTSLSNGTRPVFAYDVAALDRITQVNLDLFVDTTPGRTPVEVPIHSGVFLRNANRPPAAVFTAVAGPSRHVQLNASASTDPDGAALTYAWKDGSTVLTTAGPVLDYVAPTSGAHTFTLTVTDAGGLTATSTQTVTVQA